jgi:hypothetical protein
MWLKEKKVEGEKHRKDVRIPTIEALVREVRSRIWLLSKSHEDREWKHDSVRIDELAKRARNLAKDGEWVDRSRYSSHTDQSMPMGGFVGKILCYGSARRFTPGDTRRGATAGTGFSRRGTPETRADGLTAP